MGLMTEAGWIASDLVPLERLRITAGKAVTACRQKPDSVIVLGLVLQATSLSTRFTRRNF
jgi:hypothetical protein